MCFLVGSHDDNQRLMRGERVPTSCEVRRAGGGGHTKDARLRQMWPKGVDERGNAAITAA